MQNCKQDCKKNYEIVTEELKQLPNLSDEIYAEQNKYFDDVVTICAKSEQYGITGNNVKELVHSIRAFKNTNLDGTKENLDKAFKVFSMLESIYCYHRDYTIDKMASKEIFTDNNYNLGFENVKTMAQYLVDNVEEIKENAWTDTDGCSYNSMRLVEI